MRAPILLSLAVAGAAAPALASPVSIRVDSPAAGGLVESELFMAPLAGIATAAGADAAGYDVMLVLDVSKSTQSASGADVDEDGLVGEDPHLGLFAPGEYADDVYSTHPEDTILHAEVKAARILIDGLDAARVRVGLVTFSGEVDPQTGTQRNPDQRDATLQVPLTQDFVEGARRARARARDGVAGTGNATRHHALEAALRRALAQGVAVRGATRVAEGGVRAGGAHDLPLAEGATAQQARVALLLELLRRRS